MPLRYRVSSIQDLYKCKSNNSRDLRIHVSEFHNERLSGTRLSVEHRVFGPLFTYIFDASGSIVDDVPDYDTLEISMKQVLFQLEKFGFIVEISPKLHISEAQVEYLKTLLELKYDKIRILKIWSMQGVHRYEDVKIVAFQVDPLGDWLNNAYSPPKAEYLKALDAGTAINLSDISKTQQFHWDWLKDKVLNIQDVIDEVTSTDSDDSSDGANGDMSDGGSDTSESPSTLEFVYDDEDDDGWPSDDDEDYSE